MSRIDTDWLKIDTDAISILNRPNGHGSEVIAAVLSLTEKEVTKRVQFLPQHLVDGDIQLDTNGYYVSIVLQQFATYFALSQIMAGYSGSGRNSIDDVYGYKSDLYMKKANGLLPEITGDTVNNDGTDSVEESQETFRLVH